MQKSIEGKYLEDIHQEIAEEYINEIVAHCISDRDILSSEFLKECTVTVKGLDVFIDVTPSQKVSIEKYRDFIERLFSIGQYRYDNLYISDMKNPGVKMVELPTDAEIIEQTKRDTPIFAEFIERFNLKIEEVI